MFINFHGVSPPTMADSKLRIQKGSWEATRIMDSLKSERAHSGMPLDKLESQNIRAKRKLKRFKINLSYT